MRLKQRMNVLLPQPDGPISAVISPRLDLERDVLDRDGARIANRDVPDVEDDLALARVSCGGLALVGCRRCSPGLRSSARPRSGCSHSSRPGQFRVTDQHRGPARAAGNQRQAYAIEVTGLVSERWPAR